jgi:hypothetical protein
LEKPAFAANVAKAIEIGCGDQDGNGKKCVMQKETVEWESMRIGCDYSGLTSAVLPEKEATMAGARTIATKVRPIRRSCI